MVVLSIEPAVGTGAAVLEATGSLTLEVDACTVDVGAVMVEDSEVMVSDAEAV